jgi:UDP-3-O-[3-hydroxymyristoyl] N-acetylglucosamine deacetylase/UDP-3-O-[3-hydroxymyristoyl] N-acetylglucosamine deacetylase/3-hydroxyacyl-[acyl-carrier-protein] dehydratase
LIYGEDGILGNSLRAQNECVRHKILDCLGDFSLIGCDLVGRFLATKSGHVLNRELIQSLQQTHPNHFSRSEFDAA